MSVIVGRLRSQDDSLGYMAARLVCLLVTVLMYRAEVHTVIVCREVTGTLEQGSPCLGEGGGKSQPSE